MTVTGTTERTEYVPGEFRDLPRDRGGYRPHTVTKKPTGLDWDALTPACATCGQKSGRLNADSTCPRCVAATTTGEPEVAATSRPSAPRAALGRRPKVPAAGTGKGKPTRQPAKPRPKPTTPGRRGPERILLPARDVIDAYQAGQTLQQIADRFGCSHPVVARVLTEHGVARRGAPIKRTPELVEQVRRLYVDEGLSQIEVAARIGTSTKVVQRVLAENDITARPSVARQPANRAHGLKQQVADLGVTSRDIKVWALAQGLVHTLQVGLPPARLVDAYETAHAGDA